MMRLVERGLMFGNLFEVSSKALVARYNRALKNLTGKTTALGDFHVDISGYSPEIGDELKDQLYLNPNGCNRQFILLSTRQKTAPLLNAQFSTSRSILRRFIDENETRLFALTARDAIAGELVNSIYSVEDPANLFQIRQIDIEADTTENHIEGAQELSARINRFQNEPEAWWDDVLIAEMIELARKSGDIVANPVSLEKSTFRQEDFHTAHFGGIYIFRDGKKTVAILVDPPDDLGILPADRAYTFADRSGIARFLEQNNLVESIVSAKGLNTAALLRQRLDFILVDVAADAGEDLTGVSRRGLRAVARRHLNDLPPEFVALNDLLRWVENGSEWPAISSSHPAYFYTLRAAQGPDRDLVNMLLAELAPMDVRQLFICHKEAFYRAYKTWPDKKKTYVADFLAEEYKIDKAGARRELFGPEPGMDEQPPEPDVEPVGDLIRRVGPWGAVRRAT